MDFMEMRLGAARYEAVCNTRLVAAFEKRDAAKSAIKEAKRYLKQCNEEVCAAIEAKAKAVETAKELGVSLADREEGAAKVGAGETAARDETSVWLLECWQEARKRDQAVLARLHARSEAIITEGVSKILQATLEQQAEELRPLCQSIRQKVTDLQRLRPDSPIEQELLADLDGLLAAIDKKP